MIERQFFRQQYRTYQPRIYAFVFRQVRSREEAEDLTQDVFAAFYQRLQEQGFGQGDSVEAWLYGVARNLLRNHNRRVLRWFYRLKEFLDTPKEPAPTPESDLQRQHQRRSIQKILSALPESERALLLLDAEGYTCTELSEILGKSPGAIRKSLQRAREKARRLLSKTTQWKGAAP